MYHKRKEVSGFREQYAGESCFITYHFSNSFLREQFPEYKIIDREEIRPQKTCEFDLLPQYTLRPVQQDILAQLMGTRGYNEWFINLQTAQGKTVLAATISAKLGVKTLVSCGIADVMKQWEDTYCKKFDIDKNRVLFIKGGNELNRILSGEIDVSNVDIFISTAQTLISFSNTYGLDKIDPLMRKMGIGLRIYDEAHRFMGATIVMNACANFKYTLYLSADYGQGDSKRENAFFKVYQNALVLRPTEEVERSLKYTDVIIVEYDSLPTPTQRLGINNKYGFSAEYYMDYQIKKKIIYDILDYLLKTIYTSKDKLEYRTLILVTNVKHVNAIFNHLSETQKGNLIVGRLHGEVSSEEKDATLTYADVIVSTYSLFGTGRDVSKIKYVIGLNQSNKVEDNQAAGRARPLLDGSHVKYFMVVDTGFPYCIKKLASRLRYLQKTKFEGRPNVFKYQIQRKNEQGEK